MGARELSVAPAAISEIKAVLKGLALAECEARARASLAMDGAAEVRAAACVPR